MPQKKERLKARRILCYNMAIGLSSLQCLFLLCGVISHADPSGLKIPGGRSVDAHKYISRLLPVLAFVREDFCQLAWLGPLVKLLAALLLGCHAASLSKENGGPLASRVRHAHFACITLLPAQAFLKSNREFQGPPQTSPQELTSCSGWVMVNIPQAVKSPALPPWGTLRLKWQRLLKAWDLTQ